MRIVSTRIARLLLFVILLALASSQVASATSPAATAGVSITEFMFTPQTITVQVGDTITWKNNGVAAHTTTSSAWDSGRLNPSDTFSFTLKAPGTIEYHCAFHTFMTGTVIVRSVATASPIPTPPPTVPVTPVPTPLPTAPPTPQPTAPPTPVPTPQPTATPLPSPSAVTSAPTTPAPSTPAPQAATASPSPTVSIAAVGGGGGTAPNAPSAVATSSEGGPGPLVIAGGVLLIVGLAGAAFVMLRR